MKEQFSSNYKMKMMMIRI